MADSSYHVYTGVLVSEDFALRRDLASNWEVLRKEILEKLEYFADGSPKLKQLIADAKGPFKPWPLYSLPAQEYRGNGSPERHVWATPLI